MSSNIGVAASRHEGWRMIVAASIAALFAIALMWLPGPSAHAASTVTVTPEPSTEGETIVTVSGAGFQYVPNAPDGIYVMFGVVSEPSSNAWAPSQGGQSGVTYSYAGVPGAIALIGFEGGSDTESFIDANGNWSTQLTIPGPSFVLTAGIPTDEDPVGEQVDCLQQTCGIITIGAKGMVNANNETFTPVTFAAPAAEPEPEAEEAQAANPSPDAAADDAEASPVVAEDDGASSVLPWVIVAGALIVIVAAAWAIAASRRSKTAAQANADATNNPSND